LLGCSNSQPTAKPIRNRTLDAMSDQARAMARWRELDPTGATWGQVVDRIPASDRATMAFALVREGDITCPRTRKECGFEYVDGPLDVERIDSPCLRQDLVQYLIGNAGQIAIPDDVLTKLAHARKADLLSVTAGALDDRAVVDWLAAVEATGHPAPFGILTGRPHDVIVAAAKRHIDPAIGELSADDRDLQIAAITDPAVAADVRAGVLLSLSMDGPAMSPALNIALMTALADPDCMVAARAAEVFGALGDKSHLPRAPETYDPRAFIRAACVLTAGDFFDDSAALAMTFVPKTGLVVDHTTITEWPEIVVMLRKLVAGTCDAKTCTTPLASYDLTWKGARLAKVVVHRDLAAEVRAAAESDACDPGGGD
jgi:hypothetical protein